MTATDGNARAVTARLAGLSLLAVLVLVFVLIRCAGPPPQSSSLAALLPSQELVSALARSSGMKGRVQEINPEYPVNRLRIDGIPYAARSFGVPASYRGANGLQHIDLLIYRLPTRQDAHELYTSSPPEIAHRGNVGNLDDHDATPADVERWRVAIPESEWGTGMEARAICLSGSVFERSTCSGFHGWFLCDDSVFEIVVATWPGTPIESPQVALFFGKLSNNICDAVKAQPNS